jgi:hypothetical protein
LGRNQYVQYMICTHVNNYASCYYINYNVDVAKSAIIVRLSFQFYDLGFATDCRQKAENFVWIGNWICDLSFADLQS